MDVSSLKALHRIPLAVAVALGLFSAVACDRATPTTEAQGEREPRERREEPTARPQATRPNEQRRAGRDDQPEPGATAGRADETFRLVVIGDFGVANDAEDEVAEAVEDWVEESDADGLVTTGDNIYPDGTPEHYEEAWREPYGWVEENDLEVFASLGNHDVEGGESDEVMELLGMPAPWYRESIGSADLFILDANNVESSRQRSWLERALERSDASWLIAAFHHPAFSCSKHGSTEAVVDDWVPLFEEHGVDLVLNGHDHNYQRFRHAGVTYIVTGGGGAPLYDLEQCDDDHPERLAGNDETRHYVTLLGSPRALRVTAVDEDGEVLDRVVLKE